jgi:hypothetical protein
MKPFSRRPERPRRRSAWEEFSQDEELRNVHKITDEEMNALRNIALLGELRNHRDFIFVLNQIRLRTRRR